MNHYPNHPRFITVAEYDAHGQYLNINVAPLIPAESTETTAIYDVRANQTPVLVPHLAPFGKDWLWNGEAQQWTLTDNYAVLPVYSKTRIEQCIPPLFGEPLTDDMTLKAPPHEVGKITYWDAKADNWAQRIDYSGTQCWLTTDPRQSIVLSVDDLDIPEGYTTKPQPTPAHDWDAKKSDWTINKTKQAEIEEAARKAAIPKVVTIRQAKRALLAVELLDDVEAIMASDAINRAMKIDWENAIEVRREWVEQSGLMSALKMSDAQLDQLFALAATL